jgi:hypothetical protein
MGPRAGLVTVVKKKVSSPPIFQPLAQRYTTELTRLYNSTVQSEIFVLCILLNIQDIEKYSE